MTDMPASQAAALKPLRVWPGVVIVVFQWLAWLVVPLFATEARLYGVLAGLLGGLAVVVWWLGFSRAPWLERLGAITLMAVGLFAAYRVVHESIATGMMGMMLVLYAVPVLSLAFVIAVALSRRFSAGLRRLTMGTAILGACGVFALLRTEGIDGEGGSAFRWRWSVTAEERLLAGDSKTVPVAKPVEALVKEAAAWPGFRGAGRDGVVRGALIGTNWAASPPVLLWRQAVGPGWSSFAIEGGRFYTHEQRGEEEVVSCHALDTGAPVWRQGNTARFYESNAGAGPRATPTLDGDRVYAFGATGILKALEAGNGNVVWSRNVASDTGAKVPHWGFSSSPLVVGDLVVVYAGALAAYDRATGEPRWSGAAKGGGYSSPHPAMLGGVSQILQLAGNGLVSVAPTNGAVLWEHAWNGAPIVQPAITADGDLLLSMGGPTGGLGMRRLQVKHTAGGWTAETRWTSNGLKAYFNDLVVHRGHAFGFDASILACLELEGGRRAWKDGRYGYGQLLLLAEQGLLLVLSERGELALVEANPAAFRELTRVPAIKGKTWNHPALAGDVLLVRNAEEMAAFRLPPKGG